MEWSSAVLLAMSVVVLTGYLLPAGEAIWLVIPAAGPKCVSEEIQNDVVALADYYVITDSPNRPPATIAAKVTSPFGNVIHKSENRTHGDFAFTTHEAGNYLACFWIHKNDRGFSEVTVNLDWRIGIAAKDWDSVAKKEKIDGVALELKKLEGAVEAIHENLIYLKTKEAEMRIVSENTNFKVAWFSIMSLGICVAVSAWHLYHLKRFFQKKKLI